MKYLRFIMLWLVFLVCAACTGMAGDGQSTAVASGETDAVGKSSSAQTHFQQILRLLEQGDAVVARAELLTYLQQQPDSEVALDLLRQIDIPPSEYYPSRYQTVALAPGDSLSTLAEKYLGDVYQFYALAKYNAIEVPARLKLGQAIKIPLTEHALDEFANAASTAKVSPVPVPVSEPAPGERDLTPGQDQLDELHRKALNEFRAQNLDNAISLWDELLLIDPDYERARLYRSQAMELKAKLTQIK